MNYNYGGDEYIEVMSSHGFNDDPVLRRIKKSIIKTIAQHKDAKGEQFVSIWVEGESFYFHGTMEEFDKAYKTVFI